MCRALRIPTGNGSFLPISATLPAYVTLLPSNNVVPQFTYAATPNPASLGTPVPNLPPLGATQYFNFSLVLLNSEAKFSAQTLALRVASALITSDIPQLNVTQMAGSAASFIFVGPDSTQSSEQLRTLVLEVPEYVNEQLHASNVTVYVHGARPSSGPTGGHSRTVVIAAVVITVIVVVAAIAIVALRKKRRSNGANRNILSSRSDNSELQSGRSLNDDSYGTAADVESGSH